jgi:hypothetical protein
MEQKSILSVWILVLLLQKYSLYKTLAYVDIIIFEFHFRV